MHNYPSDITREQFELIRSEIESAKKITKPRNVDLYSVFCAVLYILKEGTRWRALPSDFPRWNNVYAYFKIWTEKKEDNDSILESVLKKL